MPGYKGHIAGALLIWAAGLIAFLCLRYGYVTGVQALGCGLAAVVGGLFPDLDIKSMGQKWLFRILFIIGVLLLAYEYYKFMSIMMLLATIPLLVRHRGLLHSLPFITAITLAGAWLLTLRMPLNKDVIILHSVFFWLGAVSHLALDGHGVFAGHKNYIRWLTKKIHRIS